MMRGPRKPQVSSSPPTEPESVALAPATVVIQEVHPPEERALVSVPPAPVTPVSDPPQTTVPDPPRSTVLIRHVGGDPYVHPRAKPMPRGRWRLTLWHSWLVMAVCFALLGALGAVSLRNALQAGPHLPAGLKEVNGSLVPSGPLDPRSAAAPLGIGGGAGPGVTAPGTAGLPVAATSTVAVAPTAMPVAPMPPTVLPTPTSVPSPVQPPPLSPWPPPVDQNGNSWVFVQAPCTNDLKLRTPTIGPCSDATDFPNGWPGNSYVSSFGQCTWWALVALDDEGISTAGMTNLGYYAKSWAAGAIAQQFTVVNAPIPNSTVVFQPGIEGAGGGGHVAHVIAVYPGGWFLVSEMNFSWNDGGWGLVDYRYAHAGWGVQFIMTP